MKATTLLNLIFMGNRILGLHHMRAIAGNAQRNYNFYTKTLGLCLVKKTVNCDDPQTMITVIYSATELII